MIGASETRPIAKITMIQSRHFTGRPKLDTSYALRDCLVNAQQIARLEMIAFAFNERNELNAKRSRMAPLTPAWDR
jgi:hypothetical protein